LGARYLAITNPLIVYIETPPGKPFGATMSAIRLWLDSQKIQPTNFKVVPTAIGYQRFEITFRQEHEAERFRQQFVSNTPNG
jgi:outer membrane lipoprotein-sorting protein